MYHTCTGNSQLHNIPRNDYSSTAASGNSGDTLQQQVRSIQVNRREKGQAASQTHVYLTHIFFVVLRFSHKAFRPQLLLPPKELACVVIVNNPKLVSPYVHKPRDERQKLPQGDIPQRSHVPPPRLRYRGHRRFRKGFRYARPSDRNPLFFACA